jgi:fermentation-respiration switch protein FrsA (DUF1100 family)
MGIMIQITNENSGYIAPLNVNVERKTVSFRNRFGMTLHGDLYTAKMLDIKERHPALIVGAPYGGVKEQGPCVYANELAQSGFVVLTFDQPYMGGSSGEPRRVSSPELFSESFSACVDFLGLQDYIDRERIGVLGICGSGGFALSAAQSDIRIKAICTTSMYDMSVAARYRLTTDQIKAEKARLSFQRWIDAENGYPEYIPYFPEVPLDKVPAELTEPTAEWFRFYALRRGHHPEARGGFTSTSNLSFINFNLLDYIDEISPRPILFIVGDRAHSRFFSEDAYNAALEPKELYVVKDAEHIDLYDRTDRIPFGKIEDFFKKSLK